MERSDFDALDKALSTNADLVAECVKQLDAAMGEKAVSAVYKSLVRRYGAQAAAVAVEFYRQQRESAEVAEEYEAQVYTPDNDGLLSWDVRDAYERARSGSGVAAILAGRSQQRVMAYADKTFVSNAKADPAHPRFAIVAHPGACGWCVMLSSNGFMYSSKATANNARHAHCKCTPCVEFGSDPRLDGYDPKALQDIYSAARKSVKDDARHQWFDVMTDDERAKYTRTDSHGNKSVSYDAYLRDRIANEISSYHGVDVSALGGRELKKLKSGKPLEWAGYVRLQELGFKTKLLHEDPSAAANIDMSLSMGESASSYWDLKTISGGLRSLKARLAEGYTKWERLTAPGAKVPEGIDLGKLGNVREVIDNRNSKISDEDCLEQVWESMAWLTGRGEFKFDAAIVIKKNGTVEWVLTD